MRASVLAVLLFTLTACAASHTENPSAMVDKPGFVTEVVDDRLWVFQEDSKEYEEYKASGTIKEPVTRVGAGPYGMTIISVDAETIDAYLAAK